MDRYPKQYEQLDLLKQICQNNIKIINRIIQKTTYDPDTIKHDKADKDREKLINRYQDRIQQRRNNLKLSLQLKPNILQKQQRILQQLDPRLTNWNKLLINYLNDQGEDISEITRALGLTSKHMNANILGKRKDLLKKISQCPKCKFKL